MMLPLLYTCRPCYDGSLDLNLYCMPKFELISDTLFPEDSWVAIEKVHHFSEKEEGGELCSVLTHNIVARQKMKELDRYLATFSATTLISNSASASGCDINSPSQLTAAILPLPHHDQADPLEDTESSRLSSFSLSPVASKEVKDSTPDFGEL